MNVDNLDKLIAHLQQAPEENFNMAYWRRGDKPSAKQIRELSKGHSCGTVACIAGHADMLRAADNPTLFGGINLGKSDTGFLEDGSVSGEAAEWLGLSRADAIKLFVPWEAGFHPATADQTTGAGHSAHNWTTHEALVTLQYLRETGEVDWDKARAWAKDKAAKAQEEGAQP